MYHNPAPRKAASSAELQSVLFEILFKKVRQLRPGRTRQFNASIVVYDSLRSFLNHLGFGFSYVSKTLTPFTFSLSMFVLCKILDSQG